jgi:hypothetical protein
MSDFEGLKAIVSSGAAHMHTVCQELGLELQA